LDYSRRKDMDDADRAEIEIERATKEAIRRNSKKLEKGEPGDCELCGEYTTRLVFGVCAPCRDRYRLG
jgi:hypothetical protein